MRGQPGADAPGGANRPWAWLGLLLLFSVAIRVYALNAPPTDYHAWRQTQTLMIANSYADDPNVFRPRVYFRTTDAMDRGGIVAGTELNVIPWLTSWLYRAFGHAHWVDRALPITFSVAGIGFFALFVRSQWGWSIGLLAGLLLSLSPMFWFFGRVHMPEPFAYCCAFGALYFFDRWLDTGRNRHAVATTAAMTLMLLGKPQLAVMAIPLAWLLIARLGWSAWRMWPAWAMAGVAGGILAAYWYYANRVLFDRSGLTLAVPGLFRYGFLETREFYERIARRIVFEAIGPFAFGCAAFGMLRFGPARQYGLLLAWWAAAAVFVIALPGANNANSYYQMIFAPPAAIAAAVAITWTRDLARGRHIAWILVLLAMADSIRIAHRYFRFDDASSERSCGLWIREHTPEDALIIVADAKPATLYFADRTGWTMWFEHAGEPIELSRDLVERLRATRGADAVAFPRPSIVKRYAEARDGQDGDLWRWLERNFDAHKDARFVVFLLENPR